MSYVEGSYLQTSSRNNNWSSSSSVRNLCTLRKKTCNDHQKLIQISFCNNLQVCAKFWKFMQFYSNEVCIFEKPHIFPGFLFIKTYCSSSTHPKDLEYDAKIKCSSYLCRGCAQCRAKITTFYRKSVNFILSVKVLEHGFNYVRQRESSVFVSSKKADEKKAVFTGAVIQ